MGEYSRPLAWTEDFIRRKCLSSATSFAIQLCLEEAFSNIVRHAFAGSANADRNVRITLGHRDGLIFMTLEDCGIPFDPTAAAAPMAATSLEDAVVGGRGIQLMRKFAKRLQYERHDGRNRLRLQFLPSPSV